MESTTTPSWEDDEWELCNDDGFVYKRRRRSEIDPLGDSAPAQPVSGPDPEAEEMKRRERKRKTLLKLKGQYQREIDQWEYLANTLSAMEETTLQLQQQQRRQAVPLDSSPLLEVPRTESVCGSLVDDLILQVKLRNFVLVKEIVIWGFRYSLLGHFEKTKIPMNCGEFDYLGLN